MVAPGSLAKWKHLFYVLGLFKDTCFFKNGSFFVTQAYHFHMGRFIFWGLTMPSVFKSASVLGGKEATLEISDICNLKCEGCHYFEDAHYQPRSKISLQQLRHFLDEQGKAFNTFHVGGAEPSLEPQKLRLLAKQNKALIIYTNGLVKIDPDIKARLHVSIWSAGDEEKKLRGLSTLKKIIHNYKGDPRVVLILTIHKRNVHNLFKFAENLIQEGFSISFNHYSATQKLQNFLQEGNTSQRIRFSSGEKHLLLEPEDLQKSQESIDQLIEVYPSQVLYTHEYNQWIHRPRIVQYDENGKAYCCTNRSRHPKISYKAFTADLKVKPGKCCFSDMPCESCRLYAVTWPNFLIEFSHKISSRKDLFTYKKNLEMYKKLYRY